MCTTNRSISLVLLNQPHYYRTRQCNWGQSHISPGLIGTNNHFPRDMIHQHIFYNRVLFQFRIYQSI